MVGLEHHPLHHLAAVDNVCKLRGLGRQTGKF